MSSTGGTQPPRTKFPCENCGEPTDKRGEITYYAKNQPKQTYPACSYDCWEEIFEQRVNGQTTSGRYPV